MIHRHSRALLVLFVASVLYACSGQEPFTELASRDNCDVSQSECSAVSGNVEVNLKLGPDVHPLKPFPVALNITGLEPDPGSVIADFQMEGMDMGFNRYRLVGDSGSYQASVTLPVCTASRMDWYVLIEFTASGKSYRAKFPFHTTAN